MHYYLHTYNLKVIMTASRTVDMLLVLSLLYCCFFVTGMMSKPCWSVLCWKLSFFMDIKGMVARCKLCSNSLFPCFSFLFLLYLFPVFFFRLLFPFPMYFLCISLSLFAPSRLYSISEALQYYSSYSFQTSITCLGKFPQNQFQVM